MFVARYTFQAVQKAPDPESRSHTYKAFHRSSLRFCDY